MENLRGAQASQSRMRVTAKVKTFVLDTNVLLHDPQSIYKFEDNNPDKNENYSKALNYPTQRLRVGG